MVRCYLLKTYVIVYYYMWLTFNIIIVGDASGASDISLQRENINLKSKVANLEEENMNYKEYMKQQMVRYQTGKKYNISITAYRFIFGIAHVNLY